jgi:uncharacterized pyridoxal phosphate-containing UPF0001 family protein
MAYLVGSFIGKTPFSKISPKKTWEGTIGGVILCVLLIFIGTEFFLHDNKNVKLHLIGKLQSNKAKDAFALFDYIHTLDSEKLAKIFSNLEKDSKKNLKYFIQVNIGHEIQKNGIDDSLLGEFINYCKNDLSLNVIGLMCIPPNNMDPLPFFKKMQQLKIDNNLAELSMGMSSDYEVALNCGSTYL